jgi:hypothetical protein
MVSDLYLNRRGGRANNGYKYRLWYSNIPDQLSRFPNVLKIDIDVSEFGIIPEF